MDMQSDAAPAAAAAADGSNPFLGEDERAKETALAQDAAAATSQSNSSQKQIELKEKALRDSIQKNLSRIRDVEKELGGLTLQLQLTSGPKKHALELMRCKIEAQNEAVNALRTRHGAAQQVFLALDAELKAGVAEKDKLCEELNMLVMQSAQVQLNKLEELSAQLEALNGGMASAAADPASPHAQPGGAAAGSGASSRAPAPAAAEGSAPAAPAAATVAPPPPAADAAETARRVAEELARQQAEEVAARKQAEAQAARTRHVTVGGRSNPRAGGAAAAAAERSASGGGSRSSGAAQAPAAAPPRSEAASRQGPPQKFSGFDS